MVLPRSVLPLVVVIYHTVLWTHSIKMLARFLLDTLALMQWHQLPWPIATTSGITACIPCHLLKLLVHDEGYLW